MTTLLFIGLSFVLLAVFAVVQAKVRNPLLPLRVVTDRNRGGAYAAGLLAGAGMLSMFMFLTYYFQAVLGYSALKAGFAYLPFSAGIIVAAGANVGAAFFTAGATLSSATTKTLPRRSVR